MPQTNDDSSLSAADKAPRRRRPAAAILALCLLCAAVFAAWKAHELWFIPGGEQLRARLQDRAFGAGDRAEWATTGPHQMMTDPLLAAGMQPLNGEPADIAPPDGAERRLSFQRKAADTTIKHASYIYVGDRNAAAEHYLRAIEAAGLEILDDSTKGRAVRLIVARRGEVRLIVLLRRGKAPADMVQISVTAIEAPRRGG